MDWIRLMTEQSEEAIVFILLLGGTYILASLVRGAFSRFIDIHTKRLGNDPTNYKFIGHALTAAIYAVGLGLAIDKLHPLKPIAASLLTGAGIAAVAVGFASQQALNNIISGIFIIIFKPFRVNDILRLKSEFTGTVEDITLRHTILRDAENRRVVIPNAIINAEIIVNTDHDDDTVCRFVEVSVSHRADLEHTKRILREEVSRHPNYLDRNEPDKSPADPAGVMVRMTALTPQSVTLRAYAWARNNAIAFDMYCDIIEQVKLRFDREGIAFPDQND